MRRFLQQGLLFAVIACIVYVVVFFVLTRVHLLGKPLIYRTSDYYQWKGGVVHAKMQEWDPQRHWDGIVIGSSHAYRGYDPRVFEERGYHIFNLGSTAQTPLSSYVVLKHYVTRANTDLVILDLYENAFDQDGSESVSDLTENLSSDVAAAELAWNYRDLRGLNMFTLRMLNKNGPPMYSDPNYKRRGFAVKRDSVRKEIHYDRGRPLRLNAVQLKEFQRCLELCKERGLLVVLATHFYPHQSDRARHLAFAHAIDSLITGRNVRWIDLSYAHSMSDRDHFSDHNHMNEAGARVFNERLIDSLETLGYLRRR